MTMPERIWVVADKSERGGMEPCGLWRASQITQDHTDRIYHHKPEEYRRADLVRSPAVKVKPLVWSGPDGRGDWFTSGGSVAWYKAYLTYQSEFLLRRGAEADEVGVFPTIDAAKTAAQADYEARIMAALDLNGEVE